MKPHVRGFTLVEVLVALVIVALGMGALLSTLTSAADTTNYLREKTLGTWIALNRLSEVRLEGKVPAAGTTKGELKYAGTDWFWEQKVVRTEIPGVVRIEMQVQQKAGAAVSGKSWLVQTAAVMGGALAPPDGKKTNWNSARNAAEPEQKGEKGEDGDDGGGEDDGPSPRDEPATPRGAPEPVISPTTG